MSEEYDLHLVTPKTKTINIIYNAYPKGITFLLKFKLSLNPKSF